MILHSFFWRICGLSSAPGQCLLNQHREVSKQRPSFICLAIVPNVLQYKFDIVE